MRSITKLNWFCWTRTGTRTVMHITAFEKKTPQKNHTNKTGSLGRELNSKGCVFKHGEQDRGQEEKERKRFHCWKHICRALTRASSNTFGAEVEQWVRPSEANLHNVALTEWEQTPTASFCKEHPPRKHWEKIERTDIISLYCKQK